MKLIKFSGNIIIVITGTTAPIVKISEKESKSKVDLFKENDFELGFILIFIGFIFKALSITWIMRGLFFNRCNTDVLPDSYLNFNSY